MADLIAADHDCLALLADTRRLLKPCTCCTVNNAMCTVRDLGAGRLRRITVEVSQFKGIDQGTFSPSSCGLPAERCAAGQQEAEFTSKQVSQAKPLQVPSGFSSGACRISLHAKVRDRPDRLHNRAAMPVLTSWMGPAQPRVILHACVSSMQWQLLRQVAKP